MQSEQEIIQSESVNETPRPCSELKKPNDFAVLRTAVKNRWPVDHNAKILSVMSVVRVLNDQAAEHRDKIAAAKALIEMDKVNQADALYEDKCRRIDEGQATELMGVAPVIIRKPVNIGKPELPVAEEKNDGDPEETDQV